MRIVSLAILVALMHAARSFDPQSGSGAGAGGTVLAAGFLLLTAYLVGTLFKDLRLPKLTGYLITGVVVGPAVADLVTHRMLVDLRVFNGVAISLIALTAGSELEFRTLRPLLGAIRWITGAAVVGTIALLTAAVYFVHPLLPFARDLDPLQLLAVSFTLAVAMAAQSPAVVVALRKETEAEGPLSRTVLGVVVLSEVVILMLFAVASALSQAAIRGTADIADTVLRIGWEIFGSIAVGLLVGVLVAAFLRYVDAGGALFVVMIGFLAAEVGQRIHLDPLIVALVTGIFICNATTYGHRLHESVEGGSLPVYVTFFSVAGATLHLDALAHLGLPVLLFVLVRAAGLLGGARIGARAAGAPETIRRYAGFGLLPQAGLALALALLFARTFPEFGADASALIFGVVTVNELVAPVLYRFVLVRSGEAGRTEPVQTIGVNPAAPALE